jgi:hypothetical protein
MGYFRLTFYYPVSDSFKDWNRLPKLFLIIKELQLPPESIVQSARTWVSGAQKWLIFAFGEHGYPLPSPHKGLAETPC